MHDLEIFTQAIEIAEPQERFRFIEIACGTDAVLLNKVQRLLAAFDRADSLLDQPITDSLLRKEILYQGSDFLADEPDLPNGDNRRTEPLGDSTAQSLAGTTIGSYKLIERIGEGVFSDVYVAEHVMSIQRKVAIKVIKPGIDTRKFIARFTTEQPTLTLLDHPNIAKVLDSGTTPHGLPYFVMELVRGMPIVTYCNQVGLGIRGCLELFAVTCKAIQYAHQRGIIHRNINPSNILIAMHDGKPVVKVIDFGVAKALDQRMTNLTIYTRFCFMDGTPAYMSPEQVELSGLDIDTRSDIYSLGVLLYELVTGAPPFDSDRFARASIDEMRRIIRDEEPPKPSTRLSQLLDSPTEVARLHGVEPMRLHSIVRGDLDWIVMKSLSKERSLRYETANEFCLDIQRYLDGDAVFARPPTWSYLLIQTLRNHRLLAVTLAAVLATILIGLITSLILVVWALRAQGISQNSEQAARVKTQKAIATLKPAEADGLGAAKHVSDGMDLSPRLAINRTQ